MNGHKTEPDNAHSIPVRTRSCVIIDDEAHSRQFLSGLLARHFPQIREVGQAASVEESVKLIAATIPDILLLDIEIIGGSGFDVLDRIECHPISVIFVTAYSNYQNETARFPAGRLLLKPVSLAALREALG